MLFFLVLSPSFVPGKLALEHTGCDHLCGYRVFESDLVTIPLSIGRVGSYIGWTSARVEGRPKEVSSLPKSFIALRKGQKAARGGV